MALTNAELEERYRRNLRLLVVGHRRIEEVEAQVNTLNRMVKRVYRSLGIDIKSNGDMVLFQGNNMVNYETGATINDESAIGNQTNNCPTITYDYSNAPNPGC